VVPQFRLTSVRKYYGAKITVVFDDLVIWPGRLYLLTGSNGSGKSTLLNILGFLTKPDVGEVDFEGNRVAWRSEELTLLRKKVTLLHQTPFLFAGNVFSNVAFGLKVRGVSGNQLRNGVAESLATVGLDGFEERGIRQLSGGEARRVALARALAVKPEVLLLDEPFANVDTDVANMLEPIIAAQATRGITVIMSTHDPRQVERLNCEVIRLGNGSVRTLAAEAAEAQNAAGERHRYANI
jgi:tungstate transport system ATP-binding protein